MTYTNGPVKNKIARITNEREKKWFERQGYPVLGIVTWQTGNNPEPGIAPYYTLVYLPKPPRFRWVPDEDIAVLDA